MHQEINCTILEVFVFNVVNPNPKALWEIIELQTTDQIKLNEQLYHLNCTVWITMVHSLGIRRPDSGLRRTSRNFLKIDVLVPVPGRPVLRTPARYYEIICTKFLVLFRLSRWIKFWKIFAQYANSRTTNSKQSRMQCWNSFARHHANLFCRSDVWSSRYTSEVHGSNWKIGSSVSRELRNHRKLTSLTLLKADLEVMNHDQKFRVSS